MKIVAFLKDIEVFFLKEEKICIFQSLHFFISLIEFTITSNASRITFPNKSLFPSIISSAPLIEPKEKQSFYRKQNPLLFSLSLSLLFIFIPNLPSLSL